MDAWTADSPFGPAPEAVTKLSEIHGWSSYRAAVNVGPAEPLDCPKCGVRRSRHLWYMYEYCTLMWLFGIVSRRIGYVLSCATCSTSEAIADEEGKGRQTREVRIPSCAAMGSAFSWPSRPPGAFAWRSARSYSSWSDGAFGRRG
jgi:hypothetical protein